VTIAGGEAAAGVFEGIAAIVAREGFQDFVQRMGYFDILSG
jgi:hypothetical protein